MSGAVIIKGTVHEDGSAVFRRRVTAVDGTGAAIPREGKLVKIANVSTLAYKVFRLDTEAEVTSGPLTPSAVFYDALQLDEQWKGEHGESDVGFNFSHRILAVGFPVGRINYRIEYAGTFSGGTPFLLKFEVYTDETHGS